MKSWCSRSLGRGVLLAILLSSFFLPAAPSDAILGLHPYLQQVQQDRAVLAWTTLDSAGKGEIEISQDGENWRRFASIATKLAPEMTGQPRETYLHRAEISGLAPDTRYSYRLLIDGEPVADSADAQLQSFRTPGSAAFRFLVLGDSGDGGAVQAEIARHMSAESADFVIHTGDLAYQDGTFQQYEENYFAVYRDMLGRVPVFAAPGNHDYYSQDGAAYRALLAPSRAAAVPVPGAPHYSFNWGPAHIVVLDSNAPLNQIAEGDDALPKWLDADLNAAQGRWLIVVFHHTPYPVGHHKDSPEALLARQWLVPILDRYGVHLVLNGHEHLYMRSKPLRSGQPMEEGWGTVYVTSGGGGGVLHPVPEEREPFAEVSASAAHYLRVLVDGLEMKIEALGQDGEPIDEFVIGSHARLAAGGVTDAAGSPDAVAAGGLLRLTGRDLAWSSSSAVPPLPEELSGVSVNMNGVPLPLLSVSRDRVVAQVPYDAGGPADLELNGPNGTVRGNVRVEEVLPAILLAEPEVAGLGLVRHPDGRLVTESDPAWPGEWVSVFLAGLGAVDPPIVAGVAPREFHRPLATVLAEADGRRLPTGYCGLAQGLAGISRLDIRVPAEAAGALDLQVTSEGRPSNKVYLPVR